MFANNPSTARLTSQPPHKKTCRNSRKLKNQKNLEKTKKTKKNKKNTKNKKNNYQGVLVKHPNFLKSLEFMVFLVFLFFLFFLVFLVFSRFFWFSQGFFVFSISPGLSILLPGLFSQWFCVCDGARVYQKWTKSQTPRHTKICLQFILYISTTYFFMTFFPFVLLHAYGLDGARFFAKGWT